MERGGGGGGDGGGGGGDHWIRIGPLLAAVGLLRRRPFRARGRRERAWRVGEAWADDEKVRRRYGIDCSVRPRLLEESHDTLRFGFSLSFTMQYSMIGRWKRSL